MDPQAIIEELGLFGVLATTVVDGLNFPIPSEVLLPLIGALAAEGAFPLPVAIGVAWLGTLLGACAAYGIGRFAAVPLRRRWTPKPAAAQGGWYRYGQWWLLFGRLLPGARTLISFPAGAARVGFARYLVLSGAGFLPWVIALVLAGYYAEGVIATYSRALGSYALWFCLALLALQMAARVLKLRRA